MTGNLRRGASLLATLLVLALIGGTSLASARAHDQAGKKVQHPQQRVDKQCGKGGRSAWDEQWLMGAIEGDRFEIAGGKLAQQKGTVQQTRDLGARLVKDHTESLADATKLARQLGIDVPDSPSPSQEWELRAVAQFGGAAFDHQYADLEVQDHTQDIQEANDEVSDGCNPKVRAAARKELPVLKEHLRLAKALPAAIG
jgi:putative membrane protein